MSRSNTIVRGALWALACVVFAACRGGGEPAVHFMTDRAYREQVERDYDARMDQTDLAFYPFDKLGTLTNDGEEFSQEELRYFRL